MHHPTPPHQAPNTITPEQHLAAMLFDEAEHLRALAEVEPFGPATRAWLETEALLVALEVSIPLYEATYVGQVIAASVGYAEDELSAMMGTAPAVTERTLS